MADNPKPLRILALDGGGVRRISTLYILKDLMRQIARDHDAENPQGAALSTLPCDYFDGLADWKKLEIMIDLTDRYIDSGDKKKEKLRITELLRNPQSAS
jgi:hypothetical protein